MISFEGLRLEEGQPIYQQIVLHVKRGVVSGAIADGDELPSRRILSAVLGVNPNTVQKACRMLEEEGILVSHAGSKSFVTFTAGRREELTAELVVSGATAAALKLKQLGITLEEAIRLISRVWEEDERK